ncbi:putative pectinesterase 56 [Nicotiana tabacum]|uniref:Pectinesterase n=1 Tax=Nicotiana tabacum TaxID=4097 RepID=A0A1S4CLG8_TOBAC
MGQATSQQLLMLDAAPSGSATPFFIHVKAANYSDNVIVGQDKTNIALIGDGMGITILSANTSASMGLGTNDTATLGVYGDGFIGMNMTIRNSAGAGAGQAAALTRGASFVTFYQCRFEGFQDTVFSKYGVQFFKECEVSGTIDFIFGDGQAYFQQSVLG